MCEFRGRSGAGQEAVDRVEVGVTENVSALELESGGARDSSEQVLGVRSGAQHVVQGPYQTLTGTLMASSSKPHGRVIAMQSSIHPSTPPV